MKNFYYSIKIMAIGVLSMGLTSCSTIFGRQQDEQTVYFDASVQEVEVNCSGKRTITPGSLPLRQSKNHSCTAQKEGYERKVFELRSGISGSGLGHSFATNTAAWGWWTLGIGTAVGMLVDLPSGAVKNFKENSIYLDMRLLSETATTSPAKKILVKTVDVGKTLVTVPVDAVRETTETVIDTTIGKTGSQLGITEPETTQEEKPSKANPTPKVI